MGVVELLDEPGERLGHLARAPGPVPQRRDLAEHAGEPAELVVRGLLGEAADLGEHRPQPVPGPVRPLSCHLGRQAQRGQQAAVRRSGDLVQVFER